MPRSANPQTREKLLDATEELMLEKGFAAASVEDICSAAKLTKGSFFHYFKNKNEIAAQAVRRFYDRNHAHFAAAPYQKHRDPLKRVLGFVDMVIGLSSNPQFARGCLIGTIAQEMAATNRQLRTACNACFTDWADGLRKDIELATAQHAPRAHIDAQSLAEHCIAVLEGSLILVKTSQSPHPLTQGLLHLKRYLLLLFERNK